MRLDHLLSKERISTGCFTVESSRENLDFGDCRSYEVTSNGNHEVIDYFLVVMRLGDTPVPIPNTTVKT